MTQKRRCRPAGNGTGIHHTTATIDTPQSSRIAAQDLRSLAGLDRHESLAADDRLDAEVLAVAEARGFRLAVRCRECGAWLVSHKSVALHIGPVCRARTGSS
jgi:hypothetical protein